MTVWTTLKTAASSAADAVYDAASGFNNLGVGNSKDPSSYKYQGRLGHRAVRGVEAPKVTPSPTTAPSPTPSCTPHAAIEYVPPPECPYGYYDHGNGNIESCLARSKEIAPDGCSFEGRFAECHANSTTGEWSHDLSNCKANDYWRLSPPCPEKICSPVSDWQKAATVVVAGAGLYYAGKAVIIVGSNIYEKCKAIYRSFWETPTPHNARDLELDSIERNSPENSDTSTPETSFNTPS